MSFKLQSKFKPTGDQPQAIEQIVDGLLHKAAKQVLLGVTGSGKTFSMANVIQRLGKKTLILAHNKTLAAQLFAEFQEFFPENAVEYFVSYYDYYQPEAYIAGSDTYIEKDAAINDEIDRLRHRATQALLERDDVIVVASVSCIYGIGSPEEYKKQKLELFTGDEWERDDLLKALVAIQYQRNDMEFARGTFRVRGDVVDIFPPHEDSQVVRLEFFGDELESISIVDPLRGKVLQKLTKVTIYPKSHYVVGEERLEAALKSIQIELRERLQELKEQDKLVEAQRLEQRTMHDLEMLEEVGYCSGIENYSRHFTQSAIGEPPPTLIDFFGDDFLLIIDESHITVPQVGAMYKGDRSRKESLVNHGFRLPCALDNRPLKFSEFEKKLDKIVFVSATPADYELTQVQGEVVEQLIRPTGLLDPEVELRDAENQVENLSSEIRKVVTNGGRVLVTVLTKKLAEKLTAYYTELGIKVRYLHSDVKTIERIEIINALRRGEFDVLVGINLLREGLDIPEIQLVAILDADKEGFLRSTRSLIQTIGRAARNSLGRVILYAYQTTKSMQAALDETSRRRAYQEEYNERNGITPQTVVKDIKEGVISLLKKKEDKKKKLKDIYSASQSLKELSEELRLAKHKMQEAAAELNFEEALIQRDRVHELTKMIMDLSGD